MHKLDCFQTVEIIYHLRKLNEKSHLAFLCELNLKITALFKILKHFF